MPEEEGKHQQCMVCNSKQASLMSFVHLCIIYILVDMVQKNRFGNQRKVTHQHYHTGKGMLKMQGCGLLQPGQKYNNTIND